jgi:hypothetical protein
VRRSGLWGEGFRWEGDEGCQQYMLWLATNVSASGRSLCRLYLVARRRKSFASPVNFDAWMNVGVGEKVGELCNGARCDMGPELGGRGGDISFDNFHMQ